MTPSFRKSDIFGEIVRNFGTMNKINLDLDVVRTFTTGIELGSFAKAADRLGRSTSAVSAQLKKLEEQTGAELFRKAGRGLALTEAGETMLAYGRRLLELNDEAVVAVHGVELEGWVRLGLQEDFGETLLPDVLGRFARAHPKVKIDSGGAECGAPRRGVRREAGPRTRMERWLQNCPLPALGTGAALLGWKCPPQQHNATG
jgi:hypothetical protein